MFEKIASGLSAVLPMMQLPLQMYQSYQNLGFQKDTLNYQKDLQQQIFQREDNAVQRRVKDLRAAGLNPLLAAGSAAGTGSVVQTTAPQISPVDMLAPFLSAQNIKASESGIDSTAKLTDAQIEQIKQNIHESHFRIDKSKEEAALLRLQQEFSKEDIKRLVQATNLIVEQVATTKQERKIVEEIYTRNRSFGFPSKEPMSEALQFLMSVVEVFKGGLLGGLNIVDKGAATLYKAALQALRAVGWIEK